MARRIYRFAAASAVVGLMAVNGFAFAPSDDRGYGDKWQAHGTSSRGEKQYKNFSGKALLGANIKKNGSHKLQDHGMYSASVNVSKGKITGMSVKHAHKGAVPVTKYETAMNMVRGTASGIRLATHFLAQPQYAGSMWIGYGYLDEWGDEAIYWFPRGMIDDGNAGAIEYYPGN